MVLWMALEIVTMERIKLKLNKHFFQNGTYN